MSKDFEQSLANTYREDGTVDDAKVMDLLADAMTLPGESGAEPPQSGAPNADASTTAAPAPAVAPAPAPAAPAPAPAAPSPAPAPAPAEPATTPVLLAKDGVHTIDYSKLTEARQEAANAKAEATRLAAELAEARRTPAAPAPAPAAPAAAPTPAADPDAPLFGDYTDADLKKGVQTLLDQQAATLRAEFEGKLKPVEVDRQVAAQQAHLSTIYAAHPDADSITSSQEFAAWEQSQPLTVQKAIKLTLDNPSPAAEVVDVLNMYRAAHPRQAAAATPAPAAAPVAAAAPTPANPAALAAQAIAGAQSRTPTTLSDIPAGSQAVVDEAAAMAQKSPIELMDQLSSMTPDQIDAYVARFV